MIKYINARQADGSHLTIKVVTERGYFSVTAEERPEGSRQVVSCGCMHEQILKAAPELAPIVALHLSSLEGEPMHAMADAEFWRKLAREAWAADKEEGANEHVTKLARHLRIDESSAGLFAKQDLHTFRNAVAGLQPVWKRDADAALKQIAALPDVGPYEGPRGSRRMG